MEKKFVYPVTKRQELFRDVTRNNDLFIETYSGKRYLTYSSNLHHKYPVMPPELFEFEDWLYQKMPYEKKVEFIFNGNSGINLCAGNSGRDNGIRMLFYDRGSSPVSFEPVIFGTGVFRKKFCEQTLFEKCTGELPGKKIHSEHQKVFFDYLIIYDIKYDSGTVTKKQTYESTNIIYGDSYGELEQILRRRDDKEFLETYVERTKELLQLRTSHKKDHPDKSILSCLSNTTLANGPMGSEYFNAWAEHIKQNHVWSAAPENTDELLSRVEWLLDNIFVDVSAEEKFTKYKHEFFLAE